MRMYNTANTSGLAWHRVLRADQRFPYWTGTLPPQTHALKPVLTSPRLTFSNDGTCINRGEGRKKPNRPSAIKAEVSLLRKVEDGGDNVTSTFFSDEIFSLRLASKSLLRSPLGGNPKTFRFRSLTLVQIGKAKHLPLALFVSKPL